jgi:hypothetical protein
MNDEQTELWECIPLDRFVHHISHTRLSRSKIKIIVNYYQKAGATMLFLNCRARVGKLSLKMEGRGEK